MKAMLLDRVYDMVGEANPLRLADLPIPVPRDHELLIRVSTCGVCHTELDEIEGRTPPPRFPIIPGHQVVGRVVEKGSLAARFSIGDRVGIAWINSSCGICPFCLRGDENLCDRFRATGRDVHGGYAEYTTVPEAFAYPLPDLFSDAEAAPLLCAGTIGYRSLRLTGLENGQILGLIGFGASAHLVIQMATHRYPDSPVFVFARGVEEQAFARELGASWAGSMEDAPPAKLRCAIDTTPAWKPILECLMNLEPGGRLVINAIRKESVDKEELFRLDYPSHLWLEKEIKSVANVTRLDVTGFLEMAAAIPIRPETEEFPLLEANRALQELKQRKIRGAKVLRIH
jgi:alcohol dehydrogenase, propanol-preferring